MRERRANASKCVLAVLPTLHELHRSHDFEHYNYQVLERTVLSFAPNVLCGEVRVEDWEATRGGLDAGYCGPVEYRDCLLPLCRRHNILFEPVDSYDQTFLETNEKMRGSKFSPPEIERLWKQISLLIKRSELGVNALLDTSVLDLLRAKHRLQQQYFPEFEAATWDPRNLRMLANVLSVASRYLGKRLLVTVGFEHVATFVDHLSLCPMLELVPPVTPSLQSSDRPEQ